MPPLVVTQSAHKTLCALRQGSYLHVRGPTPVRTAVADAVLRHRTTSPSWPLLASLDLARAHATLVAPSAVPAAVVRARELRDRLAGHPATARLRAAAPAGDPAGAVADPLVVALRCPTPEAARTLRRRLLAMGISLPRAGPRTLVARLHLGVDDRDVDALVAALEDHAPAALGRRPGPVAPGGGGDPVVGAAVTDLVLPYPPGVPLARPGEVWTGAHARRLDAERAAGADVVRVAAPPRARAAVVVDCHDPCSAASALRERVGLAVAPGPDPGAWTVALPGGAELVLVPGEAEATVLLRLAVDADALAHARSRAGEHTEPGTDGVLRLALPGGPRVEVRPG